MIVEKVVDNKVSIIEAIHPVIVRAEIDCYRFYDRRTTLFSVKDATSTDTMRRLHGNWLQIQLIISRLS